MWCAFKTNLTYIFHSDNLRNNSLLAVFKNPNSYLITYEIGFFNVSAFFACR